MNRTRKKAVKTAKTAGTNKDGKKSKGEYPKSFA